MRLLFATALLAAACGSTAPPAPPAVDGGNVDGGAAADGGPGTWRPVASLPSPRQEIAAAALGGDLYLVGGLVSGTRATRSVLRYRAAEDRWTAVADYPLAVDHAAAASAQGRLFVMGGSENFNANAPLRKVFAYDPGRDAWDARADLPRGRWGGAAAAVGDRIFFAGGLGDGATEVFAYDAVHDTWSTLADVAAVPRDHLAAAAAGGKVYFVGGRQNLGNVDVVEELDPAGPTLRRVAGLPTARGGLGAATLGGLVYAVGGEGFGPGAPPNGVFPEVEVYDPGRDRWSAATPMRTPRHGLGVVSLEGRIFAIGGGTRSGLGASDIVEAYP
jgi:N-acetylneuraminic acid mutarotase